MKNRIAYIVRWWQNGGGVTPPLTYVDIPASPSFTSPATITDAVGNSVESGEIGGALDVLLNENVTPGLFNNRLRPNGISNRRFKSLTGRIKVGNTVSASQQIIAPLNNSDNLSYYHLHVIGNPSNAVTGISGLNHLASAGGTTVLFEDIVVQNTSFACVQINQSTDGVKYASITLRFIRGFGYNVEGEGFYIGSTNKASARSKIDLLIMDHCYATDKYRDGLQVTWAKDMRITNGTIYNCGVGPLPENQGQNRLFQIHNSNGYVHNYIFHAIAPYTSEPGEVFAHGVTFLNGYVEWAVDKAIYIGDLESSAYGPNGTNEYATREPIIFDGYVFAPSVNVANLFEMRERNANFILRNCVFSSRIANIIDDQRGASPGNTITIEPSCVTVDAADIPTVTYNNHDPDQYDTHGLVTSTYHYNRGLGYRTPEPA